MQTAISVDPDIMSGTACFSGTRVPVSTLFDYLETGEDIDAFLSDFPTVQLEQASKVLNQAEELLLSSVELH